MTCSLGNPRSRRLLPLALVVAASWAIAAPSSFAGAFGLFYNRSCCGGCSFCVRPANAFSPLTCGVADIGCCGAGGGGAGCGAGCGKWGCFGANGDPSFDNGCSAFGTCGARIGFSGVPVDRAGTGNFGFGMCCAGNCLGHTPPPGPPVTPPSNNCGIWFAPRVPVAQCGWYPMPYAAPYGPAPQAGFVPGVAPTSTAPAQKPTAPAATQPVSYNPGAYLGYPYGFQPATGWYPAYPMQQGYPMWNAAGYWNQMGY